ncbi:hypothetical protein C1645_434976 [Glomus cerebriforme]|uniref:GRF-type domain-containing protein n=1 Tax=Glomus cerebriforme TaxID=658196 RepID=A0A397TGF4_9GLOM|nr:hypothetical protein C1645_434976 [Glomus cerebriforme]
MNDLSNNTFTINTNINNSRRQINCSCGIPAVLREVKKEETPNRGKHFWACSKFGGPLHSERCNFFKWSEPIYEYHNDELSFTTQNRPEVPFVLVESYNNNNNNDDDNDEINLHPDQLSERPIVTTPSNRSTSSTGTPSTRSQTASPTTTSTDTITTVDSNNRNDRDLFDEVYKREPLVFDNWDVVPEYSIPQLLDIIQYHLLKQGKIKKKSIY